MDKKQTDSVPIVIRTSNPSLVGFNMEYAESGQLVTVETCGYHAFDEGLKFYKMLEAFNEYVDAAGLSPSKVDCMLVVISPEETRIYANEKLPLFASIRVKGQIKAGQPVYKDNIAGFEKVDFLKDIELPPRSGFMLLLSARWRRGMCYDFRPLNPEAEVQISTEEAFEQLKFYGGMLWSHLFFTERFLLSSDDWDRIIRAGWFPFLLIPNKEWEDLANAIQADGDPSSQETAIHAAFLKVIDERLEQWTTNSHLEEDSPFLSDAIDLYKAEKWAVCVSHILPRIEGLLCRAFGIPKVIRSKVFIEKLEEELASREHCKSLLFPDRFVQFLKEVVYPCTDFGDSDLPATRHTVGHGRVNYETANSRKLALATLLLIDNLLYCMPGKPDDPDRANGEPVGGQACTTTTNDTQERRRSRIRF